MPVLFNKSKRSIEIEGHWIHPNTAIKLTDAQTVKLKKLYPGELIDTEDAADPFNSPAVDATPKADVKKEDKK